MLNKRKFSQLAANSAKMATWAAKRLKTRQALASMRKTKATAPSLPPSNPGAPRKIWITHSWTINCTEANPGFKAYQVKANDPYRPDPLNNVSPNGWSQFGSIYNYAHVLGAKMSVTSWTYDANNSCVNSISWGDANYAPAIGTALASGYMYPAFNVSHGIGLHKTGNAYAQPITFHTPFISTKRVVGELDETQYATTVAGGGASSPTSLWYFNILTQPTVTAANKNVLIVTLRQLVEFTDSTAL